MADGLLARIGEDVFDLGELAIFCGAGISKNSGLPLANELKRSILQTLKLDNSEIDQIMEAPQPFEAFMQSIFDPQIISDEHLRVLKVLDVFRQGEPNSNHIFIARLAARGFLKTLVTTNFDLLIETALAKEGLVEGVDFDRYFTEEHFSEANFDRLGERLTFFKLHGSIDDSESIRTTVAAIASRTLSDKRMNVIRHLFSAGEHKAVLILGYSCSDNFDLIPQIQSIEIGYKHVLYVEHTDGLGTSLVRDISTIVGNNPFARFPGKWITCNTDRIIKDLWTSLEASIGEYEFVRSKAKWAQHIDGWLGESKKDLGLKLFIAGRILENIPLFDKALFYYAQARDFAADANDRGALMACNHEMGTIYRARGGLANLKKAIAHYEEAMKIAESLDAKIYVADCALTLGIVNTDLGQLSTAIEWIITACRIHRDLKNRIGVAASRTALGNVYLNSQNFKAALENYKASLRLHKKLGDKPGVSLSYNNTGTVYFKLKNFHQAILSYKRAEKKSEELGDIQQLRVICGNLFNLYKQTGDVENGKEYEDKLKILDQMDGVKTNQVR
jgi:tetratricopeptide (TPR) repeat protein/NAD-dependent SIR2 family protein deacetylase